MKYTIENVKNGDVVIINEGNFWEVLKVFKMSISGKENIKECEEYFYYGNLKLGKVIYAATLDQVKLAEAELKIESLNETCETFGKKMHEQKSYISSLEAKLEKLTPKPYFKDGVAIRELEKDMKYFTYAFGNICVEEEKWEGEWCEHAVLNRGEIFQTREHAEAELQRRKDNWKKLSGSEDESNS